MCLVFIGSAVAGLDAGLIIRPETVIYEEHAELGGYGAANLINRTGLLDAASEAIGMGVSLDTGSTLEDARDTYHGQGGFNSNAYTSFIPSPADWGAFFDNLTGDPDSGNDIDIVLDLGDDYTMDKIIFWQGLWTTFGFPGSPQPGSAAKTIDVRINTEDQGSAAFIGSATTVTLDKDYGILGNTEKCSPAQEYDLGSATIGRYVQLSITDNWGGPRVTLGEVRLVSAVPEPATMVLLGLGGLFLRKRK